MTPSTLDSLEGSPLIVQLIIESLIVSNTDKDTTMVPPPSLRRYPLRSERDAPQFDGTGRTDREIERYMDDIETLVGQCEANVTDIILIQKAKYYCSADIEEQFGTINQDSWSEFRKEAIAMYGGGSSRRYTRSSISELVDKRSMTGIADKAALLEYYRGFKVQADNILDLAPSEVSELFMRGLPRVVEEKLRKRLHIKFPNAYPTDLFPLKDLYELAKWLYKGGLGFGRGISTGKSIVDTIVQEWGMIDGRKSERSRKR